MRSTIAQQALRRVAGAALFAVLAPLHAAAQQPRAPSREAEDPFGRRSWTLELGAHGALETWNYNASHEEMLSASAAVGYGLGKGVVLKAAGPLYRVWQRGTDGYLLGVTWGVRHHVMRRPRWSLFWEFDVGPSPPPTSVPPGGTRFNYLALGGGGLTLRIRPGLHALAGLRWIHVSNNSLAGRSRNPDIEAVGPALALLIGF